MPTLSFLKLWKYGVFSGILIGLICLIPIIGGWDNYIKQVEKGVYVLDPLTRILSSLFFWVIEGILMCWLICKFTFSDHQSSWKCKKLIIFFTGSCLTTIAIQLAARDALVFKRDLMESGQGGPLGEPSFETIGNFFASGFIYVGIYILFLNGNRLKSFFKTNYFSTLTLAFMSYGAVFLVWYAISSGKLIPGNYRIKEYIFDASFPHPERIFLLPLMISILFIVYYFGIKYETKKMNEKEFDIAISYSSKDVAFANSLCDKLKEKGISIYKDADYLHESFGQKLLNYLNEVYDNRSKYVLILVSQNYLTSYYGSVELAIIKKRWAKTEGIIWPIIIDGTKLRELGLPDDMAYLEYPKLSFDEILEIIARRIRPVERKW